ELDAPAAFPGRCPGLSHPAPLGLKTVATRDRPRHRTREAPPMQPSLRIHALVPLAILIVSAAVAERAPAADPTYWQDVRPALRKHCTVCHSAKNLKELDVSGGLALDTYEAV